jgi:hypothetical protein
MNVDSEVVWVGRADNRFLLVNYDSNVLLRISSDLHASGDQLFYSFFNPPQLWIPFMAQRGEWRHNYLYNNFVVLGRIISILRCPAKIAEKKIVGRIQCATQDEEFLLSVMCNFVPLLFYSVTIEQR